jgi:hypothetical protein
MADLQCDIEATNETMHTIMSKIRKKFGQNSIIPNANHGIVEAGKKLDRFYDVKRISLELKKKVGKKIVTYKEDKDVVYVNDVNGLVQHVMKERSLDPAKTLVRIGLDGGGGSLKVIASIFEPEKENCGKEKLDSGSK